MDAERLRAFCRSVGPKALVIVDEAYNELTDNPQRDTMVDLVREGENVLVTRTFSKIFGMAGMRVGYGMARPDIIENTFKHIMSWPNGVGLMAAYHSYIDQDFIKFSRDKVQEGRAMVEKTLADVGLVPVQSQTNFVFVDSGRDAMTIRRAMAKEGVLINAGYPGYPQHLRISMGKLEDLRTFDRVFKRVMARS
jgi:histidinol-phosphate aminotransferase